MLTFRARRALKLTNGNVDVDVAFQAA
jgi:hypothetical protein